LIACESIVDCISEVPDTLQQHTHTCSQLHYYMVLLAKTTVTSTVESLLKDSKETSELKDKEFWSQQVHLNRFLPIKRKTSILQAKKIWSQSVHYREVALYSHACEINKRKALGYMYALKPPPFSSSLLHTSLMLFFSVLYL